MRILAFDLSGKTGWASGDSAEACPRTGLIRLPANRPNLGEYFDAAERLIGERIDAETPDVVVFESPILGLKTRIETLRQLYGLAGVCELLCWRRKLKYREQHLQRIKIWATGYGRAEKHQMVYAACQLFGWKPVPDDREAFEHTDGHFGDDNEADAAHLWGMSVTVLDKAQASKFFWVGPRAAPAAAP